MDKAVKEEKRLREAIIQLGGALVVVHVIAVFYGWYHSHPWIDLPQHFMGGVLAALIFYWFHYKHPSLFKIVPGTTPPIILVVSWTALLGALFELAEFAYDLSIYGYFNLSKFPSQLGLTDTMIDLILDLLGGFFLGIFMRLRYDRRKHQL